MNDMFNKKHEKPYIICSAIWYNDQKEHVHQPKNVHIGFVLGGRRHHNIIINYDMLVEKEDRVPPIKQVQGFLTSDDKFLTRKEAGEVAIECGQIEKTQVATLLSEDLY